METEQKRTPAGLTVELVGYDVDGKELVVTVPPGGDPVAAEGRVREKAGRISFARMTQPDRPRPAGLTAEEFAQFNEMLAESVRRGVPLFDGVRDLARQVRSGRFRGALENVAERLRRGEPLDKAFTAEAGGFPDLYGRLVVAGAAAGNLSEVLLMLSRNIRADAAFRRGVLEACVYPIFLLCMIGGLLSGFAVFTLPRYETIAPTVEMRLPWLTTFLTARTASGDLYYTLAVSVLLLGAAVWFGRVRSLRLGRRIGEAVARRVPVLRSFYEAALWSNAADTLGLLLRARAPAPVALRLVGPATGTAWLTGACNRLADRVEQGESLSAAARRDPEIPMRVIHAFDTGEVQHDTAGAMAGLAERYRYESNRQAQFLSRCLPPAFALLFGGVVFIIAVATLGPYIRFWGASW